MRYIFRANKQINQKSLLSTSACYSKYGKSRFLDKLYFKGSDNTRLSSDLSATHRNDKKQSKWLRKVCKEEQDLGDSGRQNSGHSLLTLSANNGESKTGHG